MNNSWNDNLLIILFIFFWLPFIFHFLTNMICSIIESNAQKYVEVVEVPVYVEKEVEVEVEVNKPRSKPNQTKKTEDSIIEESISALVGLGHKKSEARRIVNKLAIDNVYEDSESLVMSAISKK